MTGDLVVITYRPAGTDERRFVVRRFDRFEGTPFPRYATRFGRREAERMLANKYFSIFDARIEDTP